MELVVQLTDKASQKLNGINEKFKSTGTKVTALAKKFAVLGGAAAIGAVGVALGKSASAFSDFEDAMAGVAKTTGMSDEAIKSLGDGISAMTKDIPLAHTELADIAAVAGQLGIQGKDAILEFTDTAAKMAAAFDMPAEKAATVAAKLTNVYGLGIEQASNLASAINTLGNSTAASESQISDYAMSLGASAVNMGFSSTEAVSMGATLISMGMDASDAGTRLNSAFTSMGSKVGEVAEFLGVMPEEFSAAFGADPMGAVIQITEKLGEIEDPLERAKVASEMFGRVGAKAINGLGGNLEGLKTNLDASARGFEENTSLEEEFAAKTDTLNAKVQLMKNSVNDAAITIGTALAPHIEKVVIWITELVPKIIEFGSELKDRLQPAFTSMGDAVDSVVQIFSDLTGGMDANETATASLTTALDLVVGGLNAVAEGVAAVMGWIAEHPLLVKFAVAAAAIGAAFVVVSAAIAAFSTAMGAIVAAGGVISIVTAALAAINLPLLAIIAALALVTIAWDENWGDIQGKTEAAVAAIKGAIGGFLDGINELWAAHGDTIKAAASLMWDGIKTVIDIGITAIKTVIAVGMAVLAGDWDGAWAALEDGVAGVMGSIAVFLGTWGDTLGSALDSIKTVLTEKTGAWGAVFEVAFDAIGLGIDLAINSIKTIIEVGLALIKGDWDGAWTALKDGVSTAFDLISGVVSGWAESVGGVISGALDAIVTTLTGWKDTAVQVFKDFVYALIGGSVLTDFARDAPALFVTLLADIAANIAAGAVNAVAAFTTMCADIVAEITAGAGNAVAAIATGIADMAAKTLEKASTVVAEYTAIATSFVAEITTGGANAVLSIATGIANMATKAGEDAPDVVAKFTTMATNFVAAIQSGYDSVVAIFASLKDITITWPEIPNPFASVAGWAASAVATAQAAWAAITGTGGGGTGGGAIAQEGDSNFTGPLQPRTPMGDSHPAGANAVPTGDRIVQAYWTGYNADGQQLHYMSGITAGTGAAFTLDARSFKGLAKVALWYQSGVWDALSKSQQVAARDYSHGLASGDTIHEEFEKGGFVPYDMLAKVHAGEYVIPAKDVRASGGIGGISIYNSYNFGTVYGVDDLERLFDAHDRELTRKLKALM